MIDIYLYLKNIFSFLKLTEEEQKIKKILKNNSYKTLKVSGIGSVKVDPREVYESEEFQNALVKARKIVKNEKR